MGVTPLHALELFAALDVAIFLWLLRERRRNVLLAAIGFAGGLQFQISKVHLASILIAVLVAVTPRPKPLTGGRRASVILIPAVIVAVSEPLGTLVNNPLLTGQLLVLAAGAGALVMWTTRDDYRTVLLGLLASCTLGAAIGDLQNLHLVHATYFLDSSGIPRVHSIYSEPDALGAFSSVGVVLAYRVVQRRSLQIVLIGVNGAALLFTFARASWIGLGASVIVMLAVGLIFGRVKPPRSNLAVGALMLAAVTGTILSDHHLRSTIVGRLTELNNTAAGAPSLVARHNQIQSLLQLASSAPWHGYGLSASGHALGVGGIASGHTTNNVATDWVLSYWVDGKLLAIPIMALFVFAALRYAPTVAGQCLVIIEVTSLFSNGMFLPAPWLLLALCLQPKTVQALDWKPPQVRRSVPAT